MIETQNQLQFSVEQLAKMYRLRDRETGEPLWDPDTRDDAAEGTEAAIRKIEREIAEYLTKKHAMALTPPDKAA